MTRITCGVQPLIPTLKMTGTDSSTSKPSSSRSGTAITIDDIRLVFTGGKSWLLLRIFLVTCTHWRQCKVGSSIIGSWGTSLLTRKKNTRTFFSIDLKASLLSLYKFSTCGYHSGVYGNANADHMDQHQVDIAQNLLWSKKSGPHQGEDVQTAGVPEAQLGSQYHLHWHKMAIVHKTEYRTQGDGLTSSF